MPKQISDSKREHILHDLDKPGAVAMEVANKHGVGQSTIFRLKRQLLQSKSKTSRVSSTHQKPTLKPRKAQAARVIAHVALGELISIDEAISETKNRLAELQALRSAAPSQTFYMRRESAAPAQAAHAPATDAANEESIANGTHPQGQA